MVAAYRLGQHDIRAVVLYLRGLAHSGSGRLYRDLLRYVAVTNEDTPRAGTALDLSRRMDRLEEKHDDLARTVASLTSTVTRIEANQTHAAELNKLRFDSLDIGLNAVKHELDGFMARIESIITGETVPASARQGQELVADYQRWRQTVEDRFDAHEDEQTKTRLTIARWGGGLAVLAVIVNIATPILLKALNLP